MGMKARTEQLSRAELERRLKVVAGLAVFALEKMEISGGGLGLVWNPDTGIAERWENMFFNKLENCGFTYNRDKYFANKEADKKRKRRKR